MSKEHLILTCCVTGVLSSRESVALKCQLIYPDLNSKLGFKPCLLTPGIIFSFYCRNLSDGFVFFLKLSDSISHLNL